jgi:hypothetical protein
MIVISYCRHNNMTINFNVSCVELETNFFLNLLYPCKILKCLGRDVSFYRI